MLTFTNDEIIQLVLNFQICKTLEIWNNQFDVLTDGLEPPILCWGTEWTQPLKEKMDKKMSVSSPKLQF